MRELVVRQPLVLRAAIAAVIAAIGRLLVVLGWFPSDWVITDDTVHDAFDGFLVVWAFWSTHRKVTAVAAPQDDNGRPLVPIGTAQQLQL
jgi:hypothetical protein